MARSASRAGSTYFCGPPEACASPSSSSETCSPAAVSAAARVPVDVYGGGARRPELQVAERKAQLAIVGVAASRFGLNHDAVNGGAFRDEKLLAVIRKEGLRDNGADHLPFDGRGGCE